MTPVRPPLAIDPVHSPSPRHPTCVVSPVARRLSTCCGRSGVRSARYGQPQEMESPVWIAAEQRERYRIHLPRQRATAVADPGLGVYWLKTTDSMQRLPEPSGEGPAWLTAAERLSRRLGGAASPHSSGRRQSAATPRPTPRRSCRRAAKLTAPIALMLNVAAMDSFPNLKGRDGSAQLPRAQPRHPRPARPHPSAGRGTRARTSQRSRRRRQAASSPYLSAPIGGQRRWNNVSPGSHPSPTGTERSRRLRPTGSW